MVIAQSIDQSNFFVQNTAPPQLVDRNLCRVKIFTKPLSVNNHSHPQSCPGLSFFFHLIRHGSFCFDPTHCSLPFVERFSSSHSSSLSFIPVSFLSIPPLLLPLTLTGVNERKAANRQTNKQERRWRRLLFFSSLLSSRPPALGENLVLVSEQKRRRNDTLPWHASLARVRRRCAVPRARRRKRKSNAGASRAARHGGITMTKTLVRQRRRINTSRTIDAEPLSCAKGREEQRREPLRSNRGEHVNASLCVPLLPLPCTCCSRCFFLFTLEQRQPLSFESSRKNRHVGGGRTLSMAGAQGLRRARGGSER